MVPNPQLRPRGIFIVVFSLTTTIALLHKSIPKVRLGRVSKSSFATRAILLHKSIVIDCDFLNNNIIQPTTTMVGPLRRRSPRLVAMNEKNVATTDSREDDNDGSNPTIPVKKSKSSRRRKLDTDEDITTPKELATGKSKKRNRSPNESKPIDIENSNVDRDTATVENDTKRAKATKITTLPRTIEDSIRRTSPDVKYVVGIDEAGRGPLAGPVVVGGIRMTSSSFHSNATTTTATLSSVGIVEGVIDSKKITLESQRELLYTQLIDSLSEPCSFNATNQGEIDSPVTMGAIAVIDAAMIDEINILQATLLGMRLVALVIMRRSIQYPIITIDDMNDSVVPINGCYVIIVNRSTISQPPTMVENDNASDMVAGCDTSFHALIDGNRLPTDMPCPADAIVKGDSREYCIAAASILAKVTRDRIMHQYHTLYPEYNMAQHKGYPTAAHMDAIRIHGPSPIHRLTFAPLKTSKVNKVKKA